MYIPVDLCAPGKLRVCVWEEERGEGRGDVGADGVVKKGRDQDFMGVEGEGFEAEVGRDAVCEAVE